jgi:protein transport protein SEC61 subunit alpha
MMYKRFKGTWWIDFFGTWQEVQGGSIPVGGIAYWISPPVDFLAFITEPLHSLVYLAFVMGSCAFFSRYLSSII